MNCALRGRLHRHVTQTWEGRSNDQKAKMTKSFSCGNFTAYGPAYFNYKEQLLQFRVCLVCLALQTFSLFLLHNTCHARNASVCCAMLCGVCRRVVSICLGDCHVRALCRNGERYGHSCYGMRRRNRTHAFEWTIFNDLERS